MRMKNECLTESEIAAYVDGSLDACAREKVETHLERCRVCLHGVAELKKLADAYEAGPITTPDAALARARELVEAGAPSLPGLSIVATLHQGLVKIIETTGSLLPPPRLEPVTVRRKKESKLLPRVTRSISGYSVTVELSEESGLFTADITIVDEKTSERPDGLKAKLHVAGESQTRYSRSGTVRFTDLREGTSDLDLEGIGRIRIEIE
jgi:hypothetical protein